VEESYSALKMEYATRTEELAETLERLAECMARLDETQGWKEEKIQLLADNRALRELASAREGQLNKAESLRRSIESELLALKQQCEERGARPSAAAPADTFGSDRHRTALEVFRAGDLDGAAAIWESLLAAEHRGAFTVLLLTACSGDTIRDAQRKLPSQQLYLVAKKVNGRGCFRVCIGTYDSREAAGRALAGLPREYRSAGAAVRSVADVTTTGR
jgi:hypothetical protein